MKPRSFPLLLLALLLALGSATPAWAAEGLKILSKGLTTSDGSEVSVVSFEQFFSIVFAIAIGVAIISAVLMLVIAGVEYTAAGVSAESKNSAKQRITAALSGLLLAFAAWLILNEINPDILKSDVQIPDQPPPTRTTSTSGGGTSTTTPTTSQKGWYFINTGASVWVMSKSYPGQVECNNDRQNFNSYELCWENRTGRDSRRYLNTVIYKRLLAKNVTDRRHDNPCFDGIVSSCTTLAGLPELTIKKLGDFAAEAGTVILTAGTETAGHGTKTEHGPGKNVVDIGATGAVNRILNPSGAPLVCRYSTNGTNISHNGGVYHYEPTGCGGDSSGNHWHVNY